MENKRKMAFPISNINGVVQSGMTLRDYFAAKAMQALLSCPKYQNAGTGIISRESYEMADAMIEARNGNK